MQPSRRRILAATVGAGTALAAGPLAGCLQPDDAEDSPGSPTPTPTGSPTDHAPTGTPTGPADRTRQQAEGSPLAVAGESAGYVAADGSLRALALDDGSETWTASPGELASLVVAGGSCYSLAADGTVRKHGGDGSAAWSADLGGAGVSLVAAGETLVGLAEDGTVASFAASDGSEHWRQSVAGIPAGLASDGQRVYVTTDADPPETDAWLTVFGANDGEQRWRAHPGFRVIAPPAIVDGRVLVGATYAGDEPGGETPTPTPNDAAVPSYVVTYGTAGTEVSTSEKLGGYIAWLVGAGDTVLTGYRGFLFSELDQVSQVAGLETGGTRVWHEEKVASSKPAVVTQGVALLADLEGGSQTALRAESGETVWSKQTGAGTAAAAGDRFVVVEGDAIRARAALGGRERWSVQR